MWRSERGSRPRDPGQPNESGPIVTLKPLGDRDLSQEEIAQQIREKLKTFDDCFCCDAGIGAYVIFRRSRLRSHASSCSSGDCGFDHFNSADAFGLAVLYRWFEEKEVEA